jgi:ribose-phosphate pyrophosphokinase
MINVYLKRDNKFLESVYPKTLHFLNFPDGESFVKFDSDTTHKQDVVIVWKYENDSELMRLGLLTDVIINNDPKGINIYIPYLPHARQDRASTPNQPFSLKVLSRFLNALDSDVISYFNITCLDVHSDVFEKILSDYTLSPDNIGSYIYADRLKDNKYDGIICPDKGALNRCKQWSQVLNLPIHECTKNRDPSTGQLSNPSIPNVDLNSKKLLLVDDIGTGFGTHVMLANEFHKKYNNLTMDLWVTHSSFTKGKDIVLNSFNKVYTTDSLKGAVQNECDRIVVFNCLDALATAWQLTN